MSRYPYRDPSLGMMVAVAVGLLCAFAAVILLPATIIYFAWNLVAAELFDVQTISFLQAWLIGLVLGLLNGMFKVTIKRGSND